jgi:hypothetical protein
MTTLFKAVEQLISAREQGDHVRADGLFVLFGRWTGSERLLDPDMAADAIHDVATRSEAAKDRLLAGLLEPEGGGGGGGGGGDDGEPVPGEEEPEAGNVVPLAA